MISDFSHRLSNTQLSDRQRIALGFVFGLVIMIAVVMVIPLHHYDYTIISNGVRIILSGSNPWAVENRIVGFYNPPFSVIFLWPLIFLTPEIIIVFGGTTLFALLFYQRSWIAFTWFATNLFFWLVIEGQIGMLIIGAGILLLHGSDRVERKHLSLFLRVLAYGILMIKPQGGFFIVILYVLLRKDWKGVLISIVVYGLFFIPLWPEWFTVLLSEPPPTQDYYNMTFLSAFGIFAALGISLLVIFSRPWKYWQLGGALAGILMPYGLISMPQLLVFTAIKNKKSIVIIPLFSACLVSLTYLPAPENVNPKQYLGILLQIYHLSMLGIALILAIYEGNGTERTSKDTVDLREIVINTFRPLTDPSHR